MVKRNFIFVILSSIILISSGFVIATHTTSPASFSVNQSQNYFFNITLNNTNTGQAGNITQVNITLYGNFNFSAGTNGTNTPFETFTNTSSVLSWTNSTVYLINGSVNNSYFWFNATATSTVGTYNITVMSWNGTSYSTNISITVNDITVPIANLMSPANSTYNNNRANYFAANFTDNVALKNATVYIWNSSNSLINSTQYANITGTINSTNISVILPYDGTFYWNYYACDNLSNCGVNLTNYSLTVDTIYPRISLISPDNASNWTSSSTVIFAFNVSDAAISNCSLIINNAIDQTNATITVSTSQTFTKTMSNANYNWSINCTDNAGNRNFSETRKLTVNYTSSDSSGDNSDSGSSTSFWTNTQAVSNKQFTEGYTQLLAKRYRVQFTINSKFHYIGVVDLTTTTATINLSSTPIQAVFNVGDQKKFDVTNDSYYDVFVKLNSISNFKANITIKKINESISQPSLSSIPGTNLSANLSAAPTNETQPDNNEKKLNSSLIITISLITIVVIVIIIIVIYFVTKHKNNNVKHQTKIKVFEL